MTIDREVYFCIARFESNLIARETADRDSWFFIPDDDLHFVAPHEGREFTLGFDEDNTLIAVWWTDDGVDIPIAAIPETVGHAAACAI